MTLTLKATKPALTRINDEGVIDLGGGQAVLTTPRPRYGSLEAAVAALVDKLEKDADLKLAAARDLQAIRDEELWRQAGAESFKAYLPVLAQQLRAIGWGSARSLNNYLSFADLYLDYLAFDERDAMNAASHLLVVYRLADIDRSKGELRDEPSKDGKLGADDFSSVAHLVTSLVNAPTDEQLDKGLTVEETAELVGAELTEVYTELTGRKLALPMGGWSVSDTEELVKAVQKKPEVARLTRVWWLSFEDDDIVEVDRLALEEGGEELDSFPMNGKQMSKERFLAAQAPGDKVKKCGDDEEGE